MNKTLKLATSLVNPSYKHVLEFGMYTGTTITQLRNNLDESYELFGFDSFKGLPEDWVGTGHKKGDLNTGGFIPDIPNVKIYPGWFKDTIPQYLEVKQPIALLHCDADLYSSTMEILYGLNECVIKDTIIVFDEWYYNHEDIPPNRQHEQKAFFEWAKEKEREYELNPQVEDERRIVKIIK